MRRSLMFLSGSLLVALACTTGSPRPTAAPVSQPGPIGPLPTALPAPPPDLAGENAADPLTGSGEVDRSVLTYDDLTSGSSSAPVDDSAFALPANAAPPKHEFMGRLAFSGEAASGGVEIVKDDVGAAAETGWQRLPEFSVGFVQDGSYLIPVQQELILTGNPYINLIVGPGRVWQENGDHDATRASFPFTVVQRGQNCTHNGVMAFVFDESMVSNVRYQVTQETCLYLQFDLWGQIAATATRGEIAGAEAIKAAYAREREHRLPTRPLSALATDFPDSGVDLANFGDGITPDALTTYGLLINGTNYVAGCPTRSGEYAYCSRMRMPSYSAAKSSFAAAALMRLGQKYGPEVAGLLIKDYVPESSQAAGEWENVTFNNALDMATGNYQDPGAQADEYGSLMETFLTTESYPEKIAAAFVFPQKAAPGTFWNYHSSDTFLLTRAMHNYLRSQTGSDADIFDLVRDDVYVPLGMTAGAMSTLRTDNSPTGTPHGFNGLFWTQDDVAKLAQFLNSGTGMIDGTQVLEPAMLADSMQRNPNDRGLDTADGDEIRYNNGFWAREFSPSDSSEYPCAFWVPYMLGFGGITVAMMPNGSVYYYFSDANEFVWHPAVAESNNLRPMCGQGVAR